jgi:hypothetical protein
MSYMTGGRGIGRYEVSEKPTFRMRRSARDAQRNPKDLRRSAELPPLSPDRNPTPAAGKGGRDGAQNRAIPLCRAPNYNWASAICRQSQSTARWPGSKMNVR